MGLPNSQLQILAAIENELQADPTLTSSFSAFTGATQSAGMPAAEQLGTPNWLTGWRSFQRTERRWSLAVIVLIASVAGIMVITLVMTVVAVSMGDRGGCEPVGAGVPAGNSAVTCPTVGSEGRLLPPDSRSLRGGA